MVRPRRRACVRGVPGALENAGPGLSLGEVFNLAFNGIGYALLALIGMFVIAYARLLPAAIPTRILAQSPADQVKGHQLWPVCLQLDRNGADQT